MKDNIQENVKDKLAEAVELWADENLPGYPALLAQGMYFSLLNTMEKKVKEILEKFGRGEVRE